MKTTGCTVPILIALVVLVVVVVIAVIKSQKRDEGYHEAGAFTATEKRDAMIHSILPYSGVIHDGMPRARASSSMKRSLEDVLNSRKIGADMSSWKIVWGPGLYSITGFGYDGMMYVLQDSSRVWEYRIVIRGTLGLSSWIYEDLMVKKKVSWNTVIERDGTVANRTCDGSIYNCGQISEGSSIALIGMNADGKQLGTTDSGRIGGLAGMKPVAGMPGAGLNIVEFMEKTCDETRYYLHCDIMGHSLGGVMASTLHLYLEDKSAAWDNHSPRYCTTRSISFAGPTAGDYWFVNHSDAVLGDRCTRVENKRDIATLAWNNMYYAVNRVYGRILSLAAIRYAIYRTVYRNYYRQPGTSSGSRVNVDTFDDGYNFIFGVFPAQVLYQHVLAYTKHYDIPPTIYTEVGASNLFFDLGISNPILG